VVGGLAWAEAKTPATERIIITLYCTWAGQALTVGRAEMFSSSAHQIKTSAQKPAGLRTVSCHRLKIRRVFDNFASLLPA